MLRVLADGMCDLERYVRQLAEVNGAVVQSSIEEAAQQEKANDPYRRRISANYPLPGTEAFYHTSVVDVPGFDARAEYPWANGAPNGPKLFKVVHDNVRKAGVTVALGTAALRLVAGGEPRVVRGVTVRDARGTRDIRARHAVVLASGGFEASDELKTQFLETTPVYNAAARNNTGDGIRMAQDMGAALWHMWHVHGAYGYRHSDLAYPYGIRVKRFPDWFPGEAHRVRL